MKTAIARPVADRMKGRCVIVSSVFLACVARTAFAEPPRLHVGGGASHAIAGPQSREFGGGGTGAIAVEGSIVPRLGAEISASALVLSKGDAPRDASIERSGTGTAFVGTVGLRARAFDDGGGPWVAGGIGIARTGDLTRPALAAQLGWEIELSRSAGIAVGPFVGFTQIVQPESELRSNDARIVTAGLSMSFGLGRKDPAPARPIPSNHERAREDRDGNPDAFSVATRPAQTNEIRVVEDRILLDDTIHFDFDSARIRPTSDGLLRRLADFINSHSEIEAVSIEGHTDEVGTPAYNQTLSEARAESVREKLVGLSVDPARLHSVGHGKSKPKIIGSRRDERNRRVEFVVTENTDSGVLAAQERIAR
jgi:outer membrane protein OmpA-like peptidoglycan-associated protein